MKNVIFLMLLLTSLPALARDYNCEKADVTAAFVGDDKYLSPAYFYVKEGDRVCVTFTSRTDPKTIRIEGLPVMVRGRKGEINEAGFQAKKVGVYKVICTGCDLTAELVVQSPEEFAKKEQELEQMRSLFNRKSILPTP